MLYKLLFLVTVFLWNCDSKKSNQIRPELQAQFLCKVAVICKEERGTKFGIIGDSWTDLLFGVPAVETLRVQLEKYYNYKLVGSTLGGQTLATVVNTQLYRQVIDNTGPDIKYVILSLGGNDLLGSPAQYVGRIQDEKNLRLTQIESNLLTMIRIGNAYKVQKYGGAPLLWIIHGYDYANPDVKSIPNSTGCRPTLRSAGITEAEVPIVTTEFLNDYNNFLRNLTTKETQLRYIDLRNTLGGPPVSNAGNMFDCIHPTSGGFSVLAKKYVPILEGFTNYEK
jgi:hypothetical protein